MIQAFAHINARRDYCSLVLGMRPTAYWRLGETNGTVAADVLGANNGTYTGGVTLADEHGPIARDNLPAPSFDGSNDIVYVNPVATYNGNSSMTCLGWINTTRAGSDNFAFGTDVSTGWYARSDYTAGGSGELLVKVDDGVNDAFAKGTTAINDGKWRLIGLTLGGGRLKGWVDGVAEIDLDSSGVGNMHAGFRIAAIPAASPPFQGHIADVMIFSRTLSSEEIQALYLVGKNGRSQ